MESSQILGCFLKIMGKSIKLFQKNGKSMAANATLSSITSSILFLLLIFCYQSAAYTSSALALIIIFLTVDLVFIHAYIAIADASWIAATTATAALYTDTKLSLPHLFSILKTKWRPRSPIFTRNISAVVGVGGGGRGGGSFSWRHGMILIILWLCVSVPVAIVLVIETTSYQNPVTIVILSVAAVAFFVFLLYAEVGSTLSAVIPVVEDSCEAAEAVMRAEKLVQGQRLHGVMLNLFLYLLGFITVFGFWKFVGDEGSLNLMVYGLFLINCIALLRIFRSVVYTVYYFQCMEYHSFPIQPLGTHFQHTTQPLLPI